MRSKTKWKALFLAALFSFVGTYSVFGVEVRSAGKIEFSPGSVSSPLETQGFCLTEDELIITPIQDEGKIDVFEINDSHLELIKVIGRKGFDFLEPTFCSYNQKEGKLGVLDFEKRNILIYDRISRDEFEFKREIPCLRLATDIQFTGVKGDKVLIAGYMPDEDGNPYDLYEVSADGQITFLLHSYDKYGLASDAEYNAKYRGKDKDDYKAKGLDSWFDVQGDDVYFVWSPKCSIIKLNLKSRQVTFFGQKPRFYVEPSSGKLLEALGKRDLQMMETARQSMSYISKVYTTQEFVLVIFEGPFNQGNGLNITLQFYDLDGRYLGEAAIPGKPGDRMHFDKEKKMLYSLAKNPSSGDPGYFISKYTISR
ncbi:MAG: hypothetical protein NT166_01905 [Candidatus Aminicenantes bacterium]|nr:hypothetical protein [Candidatus Aminicenantes bacterium]